MQNKPVCTGSSKTGETLRLLLGFLGSCLGLLGLEPVNASGGVHDFVGSRIERVALAADFNRKCVLCRTNGKKSSAGAGYLGFRKIFRVDVLFHTRIAIRINEWTNLRIS